jgi:HSP20 family protein
MNDITKFDPLTEIQSLQKQFLSDDWSIPAAMRSLQMPTTDVYTEDDRQLTVEAHLPNFSEKNIDVQVDKGALVIRADRHEEKKDKSKKYVVRESSASFYRRIRLPETANESKIDAHMKDGLLKVTIPLKEIPAPKKIVIKK